MRQRTPLLAEFLGTLLLLTIGAHVAYGSGGKWSYDGYEGTLAPPEWKHAYPACGGYNQSPIWLRRNASVSLPYQPFQGYITDKNLTFANVILQNNGHSAEVVLPHRKYILSGGGLGFSYYAASIHFHWGRYSNNGSEHKEESYLHPLEMHIVHHKSAYYNVTDALAATADTSAIAVLGIFFEVTAHGNNYFTPISSGVTKLIGLNPKGGRASTTVSSIEFGSLVRDAVQSGFYRYSGSLTTPSCNEQVLWTVFDKRLTLAEYQIAPFRGLITDLGTPMLFNYRPLQPVNSRTVYYSGSIGFTAGCPFFSPVSFVWNVLLARIADMTQLFEVYKYVAKLFAQLCLH